MKEADQPDRYRGRYRVSSARLRGWDYGSNAAYFVTICVRDRSHAFGEICEGQMRFAPLGQAADACWRAIPDHFPFVVPDVHIVMPNHVHGIVVIDKQTASAPTANRFGPQSQNLASILRGFKIGVTQFASAQGLPFAWQARYHDHIIRNASEWERIRAYIVTNPARWSRDTYFGWTGRSRPACRVGVETQDFASLPPPPTVVVPNTKRGGSSEPPRPSLRLRA